MQTEPQSEHRLEDADSRLMGFFEKAKEALTNGYSDVAISICSNCVQQYPNIPEFRRLLREAQIENQYPKNDFHRTSFNWKLHFNNFTIRKHTKAIDIINHCETLLAMNPIHIPTNEKLARAASQINWIQTSTHAWQTLLINPKSKPSHVTSLASILIKQERSKEAIDTCETFLKAFPNNPEIIEARNKASIQQSLRQVRSCS